jgi:hypothetical protein
MIAAISVPRKEMSVIRESLNPANSRVLCGSASSPRAISPVIGQGSTARDLSITFDVDYRSAD